MNSFVKNLYLKGQMELNNFLAIGTSVPKMHY